MKNHLGEGSYGVAYETERGTVCKIAGSPNGDGEAFIALKIKENQDKLNAQVKIYGVYKIVTGNRTIWVIEKEKAVDLRGQFYRWLFAKAFPNVVVPPYAAKWYVESDDIGVYLSSKPVNLLVRRDIEFMSANVYRQRYHDPEFRTKVDELYA